MSQPIQERVDELISGIRTECAIKLFGPDLDVLHDKGEEIAAAMQDIQGVKDIKVEQIAGQPYLTIDIDRDIGTRNLTPAHELFHAFQNGYTLFKNAWYTEGTARWAENAFREEPPANKTPPKRAATAWPRSGQGSRRIRCAT